MSRILAVIGKPISHSRSPELHNPALKAINFDGQYIRLCVDSVQQALRLCKELNIVGLNVTAPFKEEAYQIVDHRSQEVDSIKAVNTIRVRDNSTEGFNTDLFGIIESFRSIGVNVSEKRVLIVGAGGAARAAAIAFKSQKCSVYIVNRTFVRAEALAKELDCRALDLSSDEFARTMGHIDLIVGTAATAERIIPAELIPSRATVLESQYSKVTALIKDAKLKGARIVDGLSWLLFQGAAAFKIFTGQDAEIELMREGIQGASSIIPSNIALIGMMGSGKSTTAKVLSEITGRNLIELDNLIEARAHKSITQIFSSNGEEYFRDLESEVLAEVLARENQIVSCGGGVILRDENRMLLARRAFVPLMWSSADNLYLRIKDERHRPILLTENPSAKIVEVLNARRDLYLAAADIVLPTDFNQPESIAQRILYEFNNARGSQR